MSNVSHITDVAKVHEKKARPTQIDVEIGTRIRLRRTLLGMTQERLGNLLGLAFQQVQKYENGVNRVSAARIYDLSAALDVPIAFFFDDMPHLPNTASSAHNITFLSEVRSHADSLELLRAYARIPNKAVRQRVLELIKSMSPK